MTDAQVETRVDDLIAFLKDKGKMSLKEVADAIKVSEQTLQLWVDFLVEERIIGLEYKFTKPYIFLNKSDEKKSDSKEEKTTIQFFKNKFYEAAKKKKIPQDQITILWKKHLLAAIQRRKEFFILQAKKHSLGVSPEQEFDSYVKKTLQEAGVQ